jgi:carboxyl-terminal processing protease
MRLHSIALLSFTVVFAVSTFLFSTLDAKGSDDENARINAFSKFTKVVNTIEKYYVDEVDIDEVIKKALDGMLANLDAHSGYLEAKQHQEMNVKTQGEFGGLGITVGSRDGALTIIAPMEGTPADKAGLESGDIILKIDDKSTLGMNIDEAVGLMRGKPGTTVTITIVRKSKEKPFDVPLTRAVIKVQSVYARTYKDDVLYLRVVSFDKNVADTLKKEINAKRSATKGIILDLRNNPGGLLDQAIETVNLFIDSGVIVSQKGRIDSESKTYKATKAGSIIDIPMVVLVNGGSASASEIVGGSLQDHRRAVIVGERTFGKGSVQVILPLEGSSGDAIRLTIARYYLPSGRSIQATGIEPDVEIRRVSVKEIEDEFEIKEAQLKDHLEAQLNETKSAPQKKEEKDESKIITEQQLSNDYQLKSALGILRGLIVLKK